MPEGYTEYILCKEIYHCTPSELDMQDADRVALDLAIWNGESMHRQARQKAAEAAARGKK